MAQSEFKFLLSTRLFCPNLDILGNSEKESGRGWEGIGRMEKEMGRYRETEKYWKETFWNLCRVQINLIAFNITKAECVSNRIYKRKREKITFQTHTRKEITLKCQEYIMIWVMWKKEWFKSIYQKVMQDLETVKYIWSPIQEGSLLLKESTGKAEHKCSDMHKQIKSTPLFLKPYLHDKKSS